MLTPRWRFRLFLGWILLIVIFRFWLLRYSFCHYENDNTCRLYGFLCRKYISLLTGRCSQDPVTTHLLTERYHIVNEKLSLLETQTVKLDDLCVLQVKNGNYASELFACDIMLHDHFLK